MTCFLKYFVKHYIHVDVFHVISNNICSVYIVYSVVGNVESSWTWMRGWHKEGKMSQILIFILKSFFPLFLYYFAHFSKFPTPFWILYPLYFYIFFSPISPQSQWVLLVFNYHFSCCQNPFTCSTFTELFNHSLTSLLESPVKYVA